MGQEWERRVYFTPSHSPRLSPHSSVPICLGRESGRIFSYNARTQLELTQNSIQKGLFMGENLSELLKLTGQTPLTKRFSALIEALPNDDHRGGHLQFVPGRIEVLGKHTDYAGGVSLTCASSKGIAAVVSPHDGQSLIVEDLARSLSIELPFSSPAPINGASWSIYPSTVLNRMIRHFGEPQSGVRIVMESDLPAASGMSSSSALVITVLLALLKGGEMSVARAALTSRTELAAFAGALESGADFGDFSGDAGVGTRGGSQDHTAIFLSRPGGLGLYTYAPIEMLQTVRFPEDYTFVIGGSGVKARKTGEARERYNSASLRAHEVAKAWSEDTEENCETMGEMILSPSFDRDALRHCIRDEDLWNRYQQFEKECDLIIPRAIQALVARDWSTFSAVTDRSQNMAEEWLGNQTKETSDLARLARELGAKGANGFGAGFGGAVWALVSNGSANAFQSDWKEAYLCLHPSRESQAVFFKDTPSAGCWTLGGASYPVLDLMS